MMGVTRQRTAASDGGNGCLRSDGVSVTTHIGTGGTTARRSPAPELRTRPVCDAVRPRVCAAAPGVRAVAAPAAAVRSGGLDRFRRTSRGEHAAASRVTGHYSESP